MGLLPAWDVLQHILSKSSGFLCASLPLTKCYTKLCKLLVIFCFFPTFLGPLGFYSSFKTTKVSKSLQLCVVDSVDSKSNNSLEFLSIYLNDWASVNSQ